MKKRQAPSGRRGMLMMEVILMLGIMAAVGILVTQLMVMMLRTTREAGERDAMMTRMDMAVEALRRDAWSATAMRVPAGEERVELQESGGTVVWQWGDGRLTRTWGSEPDRVWKEMPTMGFSVLGAELVVSVETRTGDAKKRESVMLVSQRMLAGGGR